MGNETTTQVVTKGVFYDTLVRNNKQIRQDRAVTILEDAQMSFKRTIEDARMRLKKLARERDNMLDLSPDSALSLKLASDFNSAEWVATEQKLGVQIRELTITLKEILEPRYKELFGEEA